MLWRGLTATRDRSTFYTTNQKEDLRMSFKVGDRVYGNENMDEVQGRKGIDKPGTVKRVQDAAGGYGEQMVYVEWDQPMLNAGNIFGYRLSILPFVPKFKVGDLIRRRPGAAQSHIPTTPFRVTNVVRAAYPGEGPSAWYEGDPGDHGLWERNAEAAPKQFVPKFKVGDLIRRRVFTDGTFADQTHISSTPFRVTKVNLDNYPGKGPSAWYLGHLDGEGLWERNAEAVPEPVKPVKPEIPKHPWVGKKVRVTNMNGSTAGQVTGRVGVLEAMDYKTTQGYIGYVEGTAFKESELELVPEVSKFVLPTKTFAVFKGRRVWVRLLSGDWRASDGTRVSHEVQLQMVQNAFYQNLPLEVLFEGVDVK
jgi:hypothetical protein